MREKPLPQREGSAGPPGRSAGTPAGATLPAPAPASPLPPPAPPVDFAPPGLCCGARLLRAPEPRVTTGGPRGVAVPLTVALGHAACGAAAPHPPRGPSGKSLSRSCPKIQQFLHPPCSPCASSQLSPTGPCDSMEQLPARARGLQGPGVWWDTAPQPRTPWAGQGTVPAVPFWVHTIPFIY